MFHYFADLSPRTYKMTDDLANVLTDWAEFNGINITQVHSTCGHHTVNFDSFIDEFPWDLAEAIGEEYIVNFHTESTGNWMRLYPKKTTASSRLGADYRKWKHYSQDYGKSTWNGEP